MALGRAGITDRVRFHDLRHTYASIQISNGVDVALLAEQMGHANPGVTLAVYTHLFDKDKKKAEMMAKMEEMFG